MLSGALYKRALDLAGSGLGLVVASPLLAAAALLVRLVDGGPVLFRQERLGRHRIPFTVLKLRTMARGRVTGLGSVLRELGIDELPQLVNVLRGQMSLVGPRPLTAADVTRLGWEGPRFDPRWVVRPGLTGAAQDRPLPPLPPAHHLAPRPRLRPRRRRRHRSAHPGRLDPDPGAGQGPRRPGRSAAPEAVVKVLVVGAGNLGTTLANLLLAHRELLGLTEVLVRKVREPAPFDAPDLAELARRGARVVRAAGAAELLAAVDYVFDCRKEGAALRDRELYLAQAHLRGVCAQGSETGFGPPFVAGINPGAAAGARLVQIASCNTHATATLLATLGGPRLENLEEADLVCVRRCEDLGGRERLVGASVVARHRDPEHGTHHATDAARVFATLDLAPTVTSSDVTTPSQLMHTLRFHLRLREPRTVTQLTASLEAAPQPGHHGQVRRQQALRAGPPLRLSGAALRPRPGGGQRPARPRPLRPGLGLRPPGGEHLALDAGGVPPADAAP